MKHAVLEATHDEPAAKRRKVERHDSMRSFRSADSGYNSDDSSHHKTTLPATRNPSVTLPASPSAHSHSDEEEYTDVIARARARLYSNASMSLPSPPASHSTYSGNSPSSPGAYESYHSPVSVEPIASATLSTDHCSSQTTSGCNLGTFISLGLAVTSHERKLLTTLVPEPKALPSWQMEAAAAKRMMGMRMLEARRRCREAEIRRREQQSRAEQAQRQKQQQEQAQQQRKCSYAGFAISCHEDDDEVEETSQVVPSIEVSEKISAEQIDDFFNMDEACEEVGKAE